MASPEPPWKPPHGGRLYPIGDKQGYVEWDVGTGRLYCLDPAGKPLKGVEDVVVHVQTPLGPRRVGLSGCGDEEYHDACVAGAAGMAVQAGVTASGDRLRDAGSKAVMRFMLNGEGYRVLLTGAEPDSQPAGAAPPVAGTRAGS